MDRPSARLYLDAIGAHVVARVTERSESHLTVSRELPFLKLSSVVLDETGRRARVSDVSVVLENGTPRLVLELAYEEESAELGLPDARAGGAAATMPIISARASVEEAAQVVARDSTPPGALPQGTARLSRGDSTLLFVTQRNTPTPALGMPAQPPPVQPAALAAPAPSFARTPLGALRRPWSVFTRWLGQLAASFARVLRGGAL